MSAPGTEVPAGTSRFAWYFRQYAWVLVVCVLGLAAVGALYGAARTKTYEAQSLVVSLQLGTGVNTKALPQLGQSLFDSGAVAAQVASDPAVGGDPGLLIPGQLDMIAAQDSLVFTVVGRASDPTQAKRLADLGASAFVAELNRPGPGVGVFKVQTEARVPIDPQDSIPTVLLVLVGGLIGLILSIGVISLITTLRRPVIEAADVESVLGARLLGTVLLPVATEGEFAGPSGVRGMAPVARWVAGAPSGLMLLVSDPTSNAVRQRILVMLAVAMRRYRATSVQAAEPLRAAVHQQSEGVGPVSLNPAGELVFVDGSDHRALVDPLDPMSVVVVARKGIPRSRLRLAASEYRPEDLFGVVLVDLRRSRSMSSQAFTSRLRDRSIEPA